MAMTEQRMAGEAVVIYRERGDDLVPIVLLPPAQSSFPEKTLDRLAKIVDSGVRKALSALGPIAPEYPQGAIPASHLIHNKM